MQPQHEWRPGAVLSQKYRLERVIGEGGMGVVMQARHMQLDQVVAIKLLRPGAAHDGEVVNRLLREARAAARLRSDHVVRVLDVALSEGGVPYIVMEYLHGIDLARRLEQGPVPLAQAVDYIIQACDAIAEAHAQGI